MISGDNNVRTKEKGEKESGEKGKKLLLLRMSLSFKKKASRERNDIAKDIINKNRIIKLKS